MKYIHTYIVPATSSRLHRPGDIVPATSSRLHRPLEVYSQGYKSNNVETRSFTYSTGKRPKTFNSCCTKSSCDLNPLLAFSTRIIISSVRSTTLSLT